MNPTIHASDPYFPLVVVSLALIDRAMARPPVPAPVSTSTGTVAAIVVAPKVAA